jgi:hypothetical protein
MTSNNGNENTIIIRNNNVDDLSKPSSGGVKKHQLWIFICWFFVVLLMW